MKRFDKKNYKYEHTHVELNHGYATFLGKGFKPSDELLNALNKMAELAYNECGGLKVNTGGSQLTIPYVSNTLLLNEDNDIQVVGNCANCEVEYHIHIPKQ